MSLIQYNKKSGHRQINNRRIFVQGSVKLALSLVLGLCAASFAPASLAQVESDPNLKKLEVKFFDHDYAKDDLGARLERLEKMVFGESKTGDNATRLSNLVAAVPNLNAPQDEDNRSGNARSNSEANAATNRSAGLPANRDDSNAPGQSSNPLPSQPLKSARQTPAYERDADTTSDTTTKYPAVSAIEKRLLGKDFQGEAISKRIERLEMKTYGKADPNNSDDLSERLDRLKQKTGIDIARTAPPGTDWADDDDLPVRGSGEIGTAVPGETTPFTDSQQSSGSYGQSAGRQYGGSGVGGMGGTYGSPSVSRSGPSYSRGGTYGMDSALSPYGSTGRDGSDLNQQPALGLSQQVGLLENELFRKTFANETIPNRLNRLESIVFPGQKPPTDISLPDRVGRIVAAVPLSDPQTQIPTTRRTLAQKPDPDDLDPQMPPTAPPRGGLSKIMNGLGNLLGGGSSSTYGAAPYSSNLVNDPRTGLLYDRVSGNYIDPSTGVVIPSGSLPVAVPVPNYGYPYTRAYGPGYSSGFNNGLSPMGTPYNSNASGMRFGFGGSGIRFGGGGIGTGFGSSMGGYPGMVGPGVGAWP